MKTIIQSLTALSVVLLIAVACKPQSEGSSTTPNSAATAEDSTSTTAPADRDSAANQSDSASVN